jgi:tetratricopeptide (TPR) repeat protein
VHAECIAAINKDIRNPIPYFLLGVIADQHGNHHKAIELFKTAEDYDPKEPYYPAYLAKCLSSLRRQSRARAAAKRAEAIMDDNPHLLDTIGVVHSRSGFHDEAIQLFNRAIKLQQGQANMHFNLAASAQFIGNFELAKSSYSKALELDPTFYRAWSSLVYLNKQSQQDNFLVKLKDLFEKNPNNTDAKLQLGHAIAKTYEDIGSHASSLKWLFKAKRDKHKELPYDRAEGLKTFEAAKQTTSKSAPDTNSTPDSPIFVVGLPRTGTTLVDRILSSHSKVASAGELNLFAELVKEASGSTSNLVLDAETLRQVGNLDMQRIGQTYIKKTQELARSSKFMLDKMPLNFFYAGLIHQALPNARIIALRRGAMDSCLSNFRQLFSTRYSLYNYTFDLADTAWFYKQFDELMSHWQSSLPEDRFMQVEYETIVHDQEKQTRRLLAFCGLDWQENCLSFHKNQAPVATASSVQVRQPLYSDSIGRWKKYGSEVNQLRDWLGDLADQ